MSKQSRVPPDSFATDLDAVVVALRPTGGAVFGEGDARRLADAAPGAVVTQFWGDVDRAAMDRAAGVSYWPDAGARSRAHGRPAVGARSRGDRPVADRGIEGRCGPARSHRANGPPPMSRSSMSSERPGVVLVGCRSDDGDRARGARPRASTCWRSSGRIRRAIPPSPVRRSSGVAVEPDVTVAGIRALVARLAPDAVVVSSFDRILPADLVGSCPFVNVHYAPLPRYRGRATVNWAILNGEPAAAISVHRPRRRSRRRRDPRAGDGRDRTDDDRDRALRRAQRDPASACSPTRWPGRSPGTRASSRTNRARAMPARASPTTARSTGRRRRCEIHRLVRALTAPFPGACTWIGLDRLWIDCAEPAPDASSWDGRVPGRVVAVSRRRVDRRPDGRRRAAHPRGPARRSGAGNAGERLAAATVVRSVKATLGLRVGDLVTRLRALETDHEPSRR